MAGLWFRRVGGLDTETLREIAREAGVAWDEQKILYAKRGVAYGDGDPADADVIRDAAQTVVGITPVQIDDPRESDDTDTTTQ